MMMITEAVQKALAEDIAENFCGSLSDAVQFYEPFQYFRSGNLFPAEVSEALAARRFEARQPASGQRESVKERIYLNEALFAEDRLLGAVAAALQSPKLAAAIGRLCGAFLQGTYLRIEYAIDSDGFWLEPHTDLGVKKLTGLIALSGGGQGEKNRDFKDLGTDLYVSPDRPFSRVPFEPNGGTFFVPGEATWHGFAPRPFNGLRKSLILNYVSPDWQSRDQLAFPDQPVAL
jgi:hypothetical protein